MEDIININFKNCHFLIEFHINKIKIMGHNPNLILNKLKKITSIQYNLHHDSIRNQGLVDFKWSKKDPI